MSESLRFIRIFTKQIKINDEVWCCPLGFSMKVKNIRIDTYGRPIFDLESYVGETVYTARFEEIMEVYCK